MKNKVFAAALRIITLSEENIVPYGHIFGGIVDDDTVHGISHGVDYGAKRGINTSAIASEAKAHQVILMPVSSEAADNFKGLVEDLSTLDSINRLPWYFSLFLEHNLRFEINPKCPLNLDGENEPLSKQVMDVDAYVTTKGDILPAEYIIDPQNPITFARANCVEAFNFIATHSGINVRSLSPLWKNARLGSDILDCFNNIAKQSARVKGHANVGLHSFDGDKKAFIVSSATLTPEPLYKLIQKAEARFGGFEGLLAKFNSWQPVDCEQQPLPEYLKHECDRLPSRFAGEAPAAVI